MRDVARASIDAAFEAAKHQEMCQGTTNLVMFSRNIDLGIGADEL
jgi:hypothetical protein